MKLNLCSTTKKSILATCGLLAVCGTGHLMANVVWPEVVVLGRLMSAPVIIASLLLEWPIVKYTLDRSWQKSLVPVLVINAISAAAGVVFTAYLGLLFTFIRLGIARYVLHPIFGYPEFGIETLSAILAATFVGIVSATIEYYSLVFIFKAKTSKKTFGLFVLINCITSYFVTFIL